MSLYNINNKLYNTLTLFLILWEVASSRSPQLSGFSALTFWKGVTSALVRHEEDIRTTRFITETDEYHKIALEFKLLHCIFCIRYWQCGYLDDGPT